MQQSKKTYYSAADWQESLLPHFTPKQRVGLENSFWRKTIVLTTAIVIFFAIFLRLFHLTIIEGSHNRELADGNRIVTKVTHAPRGVIFDRNGKVLAVNSPAFRLNGVILTREEALYLEVSNDQRAANLEIDSIRTYPLKEQIAHVLGYVGEISEEQMELLNEHLLGNRLYKGGDKVGIAGVEALYEKVLRGVNGGEIIEVDAQGRKIRTVRKIAPIPGNNLILNIDSDLQALTYKTLKEAAEKTGSCCASAIVSDPTNGQVLALVSIPSFDNNAFTNIKNPDLVSKILSDPLSPILNRAIAGVYPPGSTFKIVSSLGGLASGKITPQTHFEDSGQIFLGPYKFSNWYFTQYGRVEGSVNLVKALKRSNDTYFYQLGQLIGENVLIDFAGKLNLGKKLGIDLEGEDAGLMPDDAWKRKTTGEGWYPGDTLHLSIGQGFILTTPLQIHGITGFIAAQGQMYQPQLAQAVVEPGSEVKLQQFKPKVIIEDLISKEYINLVKQGLEEVTKAGGTAWPFFTFPIKTAGKTGTAEFGDVKGRTHAWYTSYAPSDDPKIVSTILIEAGGEGSSVAAPVAKEIYRWFFSPDKSNLIKDVYYNATDSAKTLGE